MNDWQRALLQSSIERVKDNPRFNGVIVGADSEQRTITVQVPTWPHAVQIGQLATVSYEPPKD